MASIYLSEHRQASISELDPQQCHVKFTRVSHSHLVSLSKYQEVLLLLLLLLLLHLTQKQSQRVLFHFLVVFTLIYLNKLDCLILKEDNNNLILMKRYQHLIICQSTSVLHFIQQQQQQVIVVHGLLPLMKYKILLYGIIQKEILFYVHIRSSLKHGGIVALHVMSCFDVRVVVVVGVGVGVGVVGVVVVVSVSVK